jgi:hypothetical protein
MSERKTSIDDAFAMHSDVGGGLNPALESIVAARGVRSDSLPVNAYTAGDTSGKPEEPLPERLEASLPQRAARQFYPSERAEFTGYQPTSGPAYEVQPAQETSQSYPARSRPATGVELGQSLAAKTQSGFKRAQEIGAPPGANRLLEHLGKPSSAPAAAKAETSLPAVPMPAGDAVAIQATLPRGSSKSVSETLEGVAPVAAVPPGQRQPEPGTSKKKLS